MITFLLLFFFLSLYKPRNRNAVWTKENNQPKEKQLDPQWPGPWGVLYVQHVANPSQVSVPYCEPCE